MKLITESDARNEFGKGNLEVYGVIPVATYRYAGDKKGERWLNLYLLDHVLAAKKAREAGYLEKRRKTASRPGDLKRIEARIEDLARLVQVAR